MLIEDRDTQIVLPKGIYPDRPYDLFKLYYTPEIIEAFVKATNEYKRVVSETPKGRGQGSNWYPTTPQEMHIFLAIRIYMTIHVENEIGDYWNTSELAPIHSISKYLSKDRFLELHMRFRVGSDTTTSYNRVCP